MLGTLCRRRQGPLSRQQLNGSGKDDQQAGHPGESGRRTENPVQNPPAPAGIIAGPGRGQQKKPLRHHQAGEKREGEQGKIEQGVPRHGRAPAVPGQLIDVAAAPAGAQAGEEHPRRLGVWNEQPQQAHGPHIAGKEHQKQVLAVFHIPGVAQLHQVFIVVPIPTQQLAKGPFRRQLPLGKEHRCQHSCPHQKDPESKGPEKHLPARDPSLPGARFPLGQGNQGNKPSPRTPGSQAPQKQQDAQREDSQRNQHSQHSPFPLSVIELSILQGQLSCQPRGNPEKVSKFFQSPVPAFPQKGKTCGFFGKRGKIPVIPPRIPLPFGRKCGTLSLVDKTISIPKNRRKAGRLFGLPAPEKLPSRSVHSEP